MITAETRLNNYIEEYKKYGRRAIQNMQGYYDNEDEYWWIIETLFDKILELEEYKSMYEGLCK